MAKYKYSDRNQIEMVCIKLEDQIMPGTFEYALDDIIDNRIDLTIFDKKYNNDIKGAKAYPIKSMIKIILYAYSLGITGSRPIEYHCRNNTIFMALGCGITPDHSTIAGFVSDMTEEAIEVFTEIVMYCNKLGLIGKNMFAVDGCKLPSNASKEMSGKFNDFEKKIEKTRKVVKKLITSHKETDDNNLGESLNKRIDKYNKKISKIKTFMETHKKKEVTGTRKSRAT